MNNTMNPLRGMCEVTLGGVRVKLRFNNNAFRILSKKRGLTMTQLFKEFGDQDKMLDMVYDLIEAAYRNELAFNGAANDVNSEQFQAWVGEMSDEDMERVLNTFTGAMTLTKNVAEGNGMAQA